MTRHESFKLAITNKRTIEHGKYSLIVCYNTPYGVASQTYLQYVSMTEIEIGKKEVLTNGYPTYGGKEIIAPSQIVGFRIEGV
jgi:hypothetical protein